MGGDRTAEIEIEFPVDVSQRLRDPYARFDRKAQTVSETFTGIGVLAE